MYGILSLTNSTLLPADMILLCTKNLYPAHDFHSLSIKKNVYSPAGLVPAPSHLTSCTPTKSKFYLDISFGTVIREPALYRLLRVHNLNLISIFHHFSPLSKEYLQVQGSFRIFVTNLFFMVKGC
jgi:hypothetical protein